MVKWSSQFTAASASDGSVDNALRKLIFARDAAEKALTSHALLTMYTLLPKL